MSKIRLLVVGAGGHGRSVVEAAELSGQFEVVVLDNLCNASAESLRRVAQLFVRTPVFVEGDIRDRTLLDQLLAQHPVQAVLHFAGLKAVGESEAHPLRYGNRPLEPRALEVEFFPMEEVLHEKVKIH